MSVMAVRKSFFNPYQLAGLTVDAAIYQLSYTEFGNWQNGRGRVLVNGKEVGKDIAPDYVLRDGDRMDFIER